VYNESEGLWEEMMGLLKISRSFSGGTEEEPEKPSFEYPLFILNLTIVAYEFH
jgi:hypothetical protein